MPITRSLSAYRSARPVAPSVFDDEFYEAAQLIIREQSCTPSFLERSLRVTPSRAEGLVDLLAAAGIVGYTYLGGPRDVLVSDISYLEQFK